MELNKLQYIVINNYQLSNQYKDHIFNNGEIIVVNNGGDIHVKVGDGKHTFKDLPKITKTNPIWFNNIRIGEVYYLSNKKCYWLCVGKGSTTIDGIEYHDILYGRSSPIEQPTILELALELNKNKHLYSFSDFSIGLNNIYNITEEEFLFYGYSNAMIYKTELSIEEFKDFYDQMKVFESETEEEL